MPTLDDATPLDSMALFERGPVETRPLVPVGSVVSAQAFAYEGRLYIDAGGEEAVARGPLIDGWDALAVVVAVDEGRYQTHYRVVAGEAAGFEGLAPVLLRQDDVVRCRNVAERRLCEAAGDAARRWPCAGAVPPAIHGEWLHFNVVERARRARPDVFAEVDPEPFVMSALAEIGWRVEGRVEWAAMGSEDVDEVCTLAAALAARTVGD